MRTKDKYDEAIEYLTKNPDKIRYAWQVPYPDTNPEYAMAHCLFRIADKSQTMDEERESECGCLTQIRGGADSCDPELTEEIRSDNRIPLSWHQITAEHLPVFAEWQRRLDKELNRV